MARESVIPVARVRSVRRASRHLWIALLFVVLSALSFPPENADSSEFTLPLNEFRIVERKSGPVNYYTFFNGSPFPYIRGRYQPQFKTAVFGYKLPKADRGATTLRWSWRAIALPEGGDECMKDKDDSAAVVYVVFRRSVRWYTLKYVWSTNGQKGAVCDRQRNPLVAQDTVILQSGGPLTTWQTETIDLRAEFRRHFADGDPEARVPNLLGIGIMSDGDNTRSESAADYADFVITR